MEYWLTRTGIGISFGLAAILGLLVGLAIVAQTLYASVKERIKEFATLKAMGADNRCIGRFLVSQALDRQCHSRLNAGSPWGCLHRRSD
jgi:putative ABC transport system permease protein